MNFRNAYSPTQNVEKEFKNPSMTDQQYKQDCDIGFIVENYAKLGKTIDNTNLNYFDCTSVSDYQNAQMIVAQAKSNFEMLPSKERDRFETVENYLAFVSDPKNLKESYEKGFIDRGSVDLSDVYPDRYKVSQEIVETPVQEASTPVDIPPSEPLKTVG